MHRLGHGRLDLLLCFCSNHKIKRKHAAARQWKMPHSRSRQVVLGRWWAKMRTCIACRHGCHKSCFIAFRLLATRGLPPIILTTQTLHVTPDYISHVPFHWLRFSPSANYTHYKNQSQTTIQHMVSIVCIYFSPSDSIFMEPVLYSIV